MIDKVLLKCRLLKLKRFVLGCFCAKRNKINNITGWSVAKEKHTQYCAV